MGTCLTSPVVDISIFLIPSLFLPMSVSPPPLISYAISLLLFLSLALLPLALNSECNRDQKGATISKKSSFVSIIGINEI